MIRAAQPLAESGHLKDFHELAQGYFARGIEQRLMESGRLSGLPQRNWRTAARAGSLLSLSLCWLERGEKESPRAMDELFHQMVWKGLQHARS